MTIDLSVIIPVGSVDDYLEKALSSIELFRETQSRDTEILIINEDTKSLENCTRLSKNMSQTNKTQSERGLAYAET